MKMPRLPLLGLMLAAIAACRRPAQPPSAGPTTATSAPWTPTRRQETVQLSFLSNIYEPLVRRDPRSEAGPALATSWEQTSPTVWRFHLRPDVKWQDGSPFTADDVVFSLERIHGQDLGHARADVAW